MGFSETVFSYYSFFIFLKAADSTAFWHASLMIHSCFLSFSASLRLGASIFLQAVDRPDDALLHQRRPEVEDVSEFHAGEPQVGLNLLAVRPAEHLNGLQLDDDLAGHEQIGAKGLVEGDAFVKNRNGNLALDGQSALLQFIVHHDLIDRFEQPRPQLAMDLDRGPNQDGADFIFRHGDFSRRERKDAEVKKTGREKPTGVRNPESRI